MPKYYSKRNKFYERNYYQRHKMKARHQAYRNTTHMFIKKWANSKDHQDIKQWLKENVPTDKRADSNSNQK